MDNAQLKSWVEEQWRLGGLKAFMEQFEKRKKSLTQAALERGDHEHEKGQVAALAWACKLPESLMTENDDTGADT